MALSLRFSHAHQLRSGITENVSATGMYILASHIPNAGELLPLTLISAAGLTQVELLAEVRWGRATSSLDFPEPGFGVQLIEIVASKRDHQGLIALLESLGVEGARSHVHIETRDNTPLAVCRFA
jgi:hypothetical protein